MVLQTLRQVGFLRTEERKVWETRAIYANLDSLTADLLARTGRSILHELTDNELQDFVTYITYIEEHALNDDGTEIVEQDRWTIWSGMK